MIFIKTKLLFRKAFNNHTESNRYKKALGFYNERKEDYIEAAKKLAKYINKDKSIVDVGANIGFFSLMLIKELGFNGDAYLFEPVPYLAKFCKKTFKGKENKIHIYNFGLGDDNVTNTIYISKDDNIGWNTLVKEKVRTPMETSEIAIKKFDDLGIENLGFIKIDVEGYEHKVIRGMMDTIKKYSPVLMIEVGWGKNSHPHWDEEVEAFKSLFQLGYKSFSLDGEEINFFEISETSDVLLLKSE